MADEEHGYDVNFVEGISLHLTCAICHLALRNPVCFVDCGHRLCRSCYTEMKENAVRGNLPLLCPYDRTEVDVSKVFEDSGMSRLIQDMKVKCNYFTNGCSWIGELGNLEYHLHNDCTVKEKQRTCDVLENLQSRLDVFEVRIQENEKEILQLKIQNQKKDIVIDMMKGKMFSLQENVEKLKKLSDNVSTGMTKECDSSSILLDADASALSEQVLCDLSPSLSIRSAYEEAEIELHSDMSSDISSHSEEEPIVATDTISPHQQENDLGKQLASMKEKLDIIEQLTSNKKVVFKWKVENYNFCKEIGDVFSPTFYSCMNGHCCVLGLEWSGNRKGKLGLFFSVCRNKEGKALKRPFRYEVELEISGKDYEKEYENFPFEFCIKNQDRFNIPPGLDRSVGLGKDDFLTMPRLKDFVFRDRMFITCTLTPHY